MYSGCTSVLMMHIYFENEPVFCGIFSFQRMHQYTDDASYYENASVFCEGNQYSVKIDLWRGCTNVPDF